MYRYIFIIMMTITGLQNLPASANSLAEQIREDCEADVEAYGFISPVEREQAIRDCIETMTPSYSSDLSQEPGDPDQAR